MTVVSVETLEELKLTWLRRITCIFYSLNYDVNIELLYNKVQNDHSGRFFLFFDRQCWLI